MDYNCTSTCMASKNESESYGVTILETALWRRARLSRSTLYYLTDKGHPTLHGLPTHALDPNYLKYLHCFQLNYAIVIFVSLVPKSGTSGRETWKILKHGLKCYNSLSNNYSRLLEQISDLIHVSKSLCHLWHLWHK